MATKKAIMSEEIEDQKAKWKKMSLDEKIQALETKLTQLSAEYNHTNGMLQVLKEMKEEGS